jgi:thiol:disulfide interchange protein DsbD
MKKIVFLSLIFATVGMSANPVSWSYSVKPLEGNKAELIFSANIDPSYQMYATEVPKNGPLPTVFVFDDAKTFKKVGKIKEVPAAKVKYDEMFDMEIGVHTGSPKFIQVIEILNEKDFTITGTIDYMVCDDASCLPQDYDFSFSVKGVSQAAAPTAKASTEQAPAKEPKVELEITDAAANVEAASDEISTSAETPEQSEQSETIWMFILLALGFGFGAVLTPCVFPMIPMTVSFFMSGGAKRSEGIMKGLIFGFSVALIYSLLGVLVAITKNPAIVNALSTSWIANAIFFALFITFACSFFGLFEITLPAGLSNKLDAKADKGGLIAAFFMAAVLTLVSFSCTGPFVALLLVEAAMGTSVLKPILGMFAFGLAMGSPFMVLAVSPALMKKMPKSGGWLNSVKVVFAFIMLAFSMTFLLTIDTGYGLHLFTREVYIGIWIVLFSLMGFYLLGKIKFSHDSDVQHVGVFRLFLVLAVFSFVVYLVPGLFGAPLKMISSFTPPMSAQQFNLQKAAAHAPFTENTQVSKSVKYGDKFTLPHGLQGYFDYAEGLAHAKQTGKPIFIDFTGRTCKNCKKMEAEVWSDPEVLALFNEYTIIALYADDQTVLPENEWVTSEVDGKVKKTIGKVNQDFQLQHFKTNALPYYVVLDSEGKPLTDKGIGYVSKAEFIGFLKKGLGR